VLRSLQADEKVRAAQSSAICSCILSSKEYRKASVIGGYVPLPWEADVMPVLLDALASGKKLALPLCGKAPEMSLRLVSSLEALVPGAYGIPAPAENTEIVDTETVDLLLVPLEGIDSEGFRLGKGGGYYDHLLAQSRVFTVGCAFSWQWVEGVPREPWDQPLSACADMQGMHYFNR